MDAGNVGADCAPDGSTHPANRVLEVGAGPVRSRQRSLAAGADLTAFDLDDSLGRHLTLA